VAVLNSRRWCLDFSGIQSSEALERLAGGDERPSDAEVIARIADERLTDVVLVDVTAGPTAPLHLSALKARFHVVTANKVPLSGPQAEYDGLVAARDAGRVTYGYETTFGAGLPVLHALKELVATGDELLSITGCFSGTLGFVCSRLQAGEALADVVSEAADLGYTEPDPREDLSGRDVARKALIVARAIGCRLQPEQVELEPMVPGLEAGLAQALRAHQPVLSGQIDVASERGEVLRYVAEITAQRVSVGMRAVPALGPIGGLQGPDNILVFKTARYDSYPLVIRGPGAGAEVTAAGVLGDILSVAQGR
jgi:homoserine dehydrogenase